MNSGVQPGMSNFYSDHLERLVQGYAGLVQIDVAKRYALDCVNALAKRDLLMWGELPDLVAARAKEIKNARISG